MPTLHHSTDMWTYRPLPWQYIVTTNATINARGELVMGAGAAKEAAERWKWLPAAAADAFRWMDNPELYGYQEVADAGVRDGEHVPGIGIFQVKNDWREPAKLYVIKYSAELLHEAATRSPYYQYYMNAPGIGNGRLDWGTVYPLMRELPDNVHIFFK